MTVALTRLQAGIESAFGTPVAATRKQYEIGGPPKEIRELEYVPQARANFVANYDSIETHFHAALDLEAPALSFTDLAFWAELFLQGGVTAGAAPGYLRTYNGVATANDLKSATIEGGDNISGFRMSGAVGKSLEISGKGGTSPTPITAKYSLMGVDADDQAFTAALADRNQVYMRFRDTAVTIDATAGALGTTPLTATLMGFAIKLDNSPALLFFGDGAGKAGAWDRDERYMELSLDLRFNATALTQFQQYQSKARRYIRLTNTSPTANNIFQLNFCGDFESFDWGAEGPTRKITLMARSIYDATLGYDWQIALTNGVATL